MSIRLLICEPDEQLLTEYLTYFNRTTDFESEPSLDVFQCLAKINTFDPDVLLLEPEWPGEATLTILADAHVPVLVLSRFTRQEAKIIPPNVCEYFVKPIPLIKVVATIQRIADQAK